MWLVHHQPPVINRTEAIFHHIVALNVRRMKSLHCVKQLLLFSSFFSNVTTLQNIKRVIYQKYRCEECNTQTAPVHVDTFRTCAIIGPEPHCSPSRHYHRGFHDTKLHRNPTTCSHFHWLHLNRCTHSIEAENVRIKVSFQIYRKYQSFLPRKIFLVVFVAC